MSGLIMGLIPLEGFEPPGVQTFDIPPFFESLPWFDKYLLQGSFR
jgi:F-type H+-transporting ATPase subunit a